MPELLPGSKPWLCHVAAVWLRASHLASLSAHFLTPKHRGNHRLPGGAGAAGTRQADQ